MYIYQLIYIKCIIFLCINFCMTKFGFFKTAKKAFQTVKIPHKLLDVMIDIKGPQRSPSFCQHFTFSCLSTKMEQFFTISICCLHIFNNANTRFAKKEQNVINLYFSKSCYCIEINRQVGFSLPKNNLRQARAELGQGQ